MQTEHKSLVNPPQDSVPSCRTTTDWELVCPDGGVRHFPYANKLDAEYDATLCSEEGCQIFPESFSLEAKRPACVGGPHQVVPARKIRQEPKVNVRTGSTFPAVAEALAAAQQAAWSRCATVALSIASRLRDS